MPGVPDLMNPAIRRTMVICQKLAPPVWGRLKVGRLYGRKFEMRRQAIDEVIDWLAFYNPPATAFDSGLCRPDAV